MTASDLKAADAVPSLSPESQAAALWTFVQLKAPRFSSADALAVIEELAVTPGEDVKTLTSRLRDAMAERGVTLKQAHALDAAARLLGHASWHAANRAVTERPLRFIGNLPAMELPVAAWSDAVHWLSQYCDAQVESGGTRTFLVSFSANAVCIDVPKSHVTGKDGRITPFLQVQWRAEDTKQLAGAVMAIESLRRRYEERGSAFIEGLAATQFCLKTPHVQAEAADPLHSELVLLDASDGPSHGEEVARGDEEQCWSQFDTLHSGHRDRPWALDGAAWLVDGRRYVWQLSTLRPRLPLPQLVARPLTVDESAKLFRRFQLALKSVSSFFLEDRAKRLSGVRPDELLFDVDWDRVSLDILRGGHKRLQPPGLAVNGRRPHLTAEAFFNMVTALKVSHPNMLLRKPERTELTLMKDDSLLRALVSRVEDVVFEVPRSMDRDLAAKVEAAVSTFHTALRHQFVDANGEVVTVFPRTSPYLVYANQGKDLLETLDALGLVAYGGVITQVSRMRHKVGADGPSQRIVESALFLDIDFWESAQ
jgi:hypothetical protein